MAERKAHEVDSWLARPDPASRLILLYGPDRGLVSERAAAFVAAQGFDPADPFSVLRTDAAMVSEPGRLLDELRAIPMFGGVRLVWLRNATAARELADAVSVIAADPPPESMLLIEAGDLRKGIALRTAFERSATAMALPCYGDDGRAVDRLLDTALTEAGMRMTGEARSQFRAMLGADRLASRAEIEKLVLYCHGMETIGVEEVLASAGDVSSLTIDAVIDSVIAGRTAQFDLAFARSISGGMQPGAAIAAMMRLMQQLQQLRHQMDKTGTKAAAVVAAARPPVFFARRALISDALAAWNGNAIASALDRLQQATLDVRASALAVSACHRILLSLCLEAARMSRRNAA